MTVKEETRKLTLRQREGRAINAVAELLRRKLSVPNIYLHPPASLVSADILAVDRGGAGDLHAIEINLERDISPSESQFGKPSSPEELEEQYKAWYPKFCEKLRGIYRQVMAMPAHYRYLAIPEQSLVLARGELERFGLFPKDGIGRLGIITIKENGGEMPTAGIAVAPERFRMDATKLRAIETRLLEKSRPDIEVRI